jgi:hypothetical protein
VSRICEAIAFCSSSESVPTFRSTSSSNWVMGSAYQTLLTGAS